MNIVIDVLFFLVGLSMLIFAWLKSDWFMNHRRSRFWVKLLGETGYRILTGSLGVFLMVRATLALLGIPWLEK